MTTISAGFSQAGSAGFGARNTVLTGAAQARERLDTLTRQASSGRVADTYGGLGAAAGTSLSLRPALSRIAAYQSNIDAVQGRMEVAQSSLEQIGAIASDFRARTADLNGLSAEMVDGVAAAARDALRSVAGLLNAKQGDQYVFAGQDSGRAPVPDADAILGSGFATQIRAAVAQLGTNGAAATAAATRAIATSDAAGTTPFSASLATAAPARVPVGDGPATTVGVLANANAEAVSGAADSTGSYMRDILRGLATLGALDSSQMGTADFDTLVAGVRDGLADAVSALGVDSGVLGNRQAAMAAERGRLDDTATVLSGQVSDAEDVDMADVLSRLSLAQTRLQASYQLLAGLQSLSLTKFLSAG